MYTYEITGLLFIKVTTMNVYEVDKAVSDHWIVTMQKGSPAGGTVTWRWYNKVTVNNQLFSSRLHCLMLIWKNSNIYL